MTLPELCIRRPVLAAVMSLLIIVIGLLSLTRLPVRELPDIDAAAVTVTTRYTGAAPEIISTQITETIEGAVAGVSGISLMRSSSSRGVSRTVIGFSQGVDIDQAANDVRGAVGRVMNQLPDEADEPRVAKNDSDADPVMRLGVISDRMTTAAITDYAKRFLVDRLATLDGVAAVEISGKREYAMRIALDPAAMAARQLTVTDVAEAITANNIELPAGEVISAFRQFQLRATTRLSTPDEFRQIVVRVVNGVPVRLGDVANIFIGVEDDQTIVRRLGGNAIGLSITRQSQSNTIAISQAIRAELERLRPTLPEGMRIAVGSDDAVFIRQSIEEVLRTLGIAVMLVVVVIFVFLGSPRATIVPAVTIPVALIGAFIGIDAFGFSLNILTLFALILAIGIVVDDAIVVLETIQRRVHHGQPPVAAAAVGTREVTFAVVATSVTLISVFVPISFLEGQAGRLFTEFGVVLAIAVTFSTFVALTLCPVLCVLLLRQGSGGWLERLGTSALQQVEGGYRRLLCAVLGYPLVVIAVSGVIALAAVRLFEMVPHELAPSEDRGVFFVMVSTPPGSSAAFTDREAQHVEEVLDPLLESGEALEITSIVGFRGQPSRAFVIVRLADRAVRDRSSQQIVSGLFGPLSGVPGARAFPIQPAGLGLWGSRTPLRVEVQGADFADVQTWSQTLLEALREVPGLVNLDTNYERTQPELRIEIDRPLADDLGVSIADTAATLQTFFASRQVTGYVDRGREYPVILQGAESARRTAGDLDRVYVRARESGVLVPLSGLLTVHEGTASASLHRHDRLPSIRISGSLTDGMTLGRAIKIVEEIAAAILPSDAQISFSGQSQQYLETSGGMLVTFVFALIIVYLVLAAQFESFIDPAIIMLSVPLSITGALGTIWLMGGTLNIYSQIGMILLVGLMAKNGILIVEFANQLRDRGYSVRDAVLEGSVRRLRPILMTVLSTVLGAVPLVLSSGAGWESRAAIGIVIIGGFGFAAMLTLLLTPVLYDLMARLTKPRAASARALDAAMSHVEQQ